MSANAYVREGDRWPSSTITYYVRASGYARSVDRAARTWNHANVGVRFARSSLAGAEVVVHYGGAPCNGQATVGYVFRGRGDVALGRGCGAGLISLTAVHEFGHVLGLGHENRRCARMNPAFNQTGTPNHCPRHSLRYWLAHPLRVDDIAGARSLYAP